jgi:hypothetical protein
MHARVQALEVFLQILPVLVPRDAVHPRRGLRANRPIRRPKTIDVNVMQKRGEPHILIRARHMAHAIQPAWRALPSTESGTR